MLVTQIMSPDVITVTPDTPLSEVARLMAAQGVSGVPVVDPRDGTMVGMITELDMVEREARVPAPASTLLFHALLVFQRQGIEEHLKTILATRAEELMERTVYSIREDASIQEVATLMFERKVNPVPVISLDDELIGIVSRADVVRLMARDFTEPGGEEGPEGGRSPADLPYAAEGGLEAAGPVAAGPVEGAPIARGGGGRTLVVTSDDLADDARNRREG